MLKRVIEDTGFIKKIAEIKNKSQTNIKKYNRFHSETLKGSVQEYLLLNFEQTDMLV